MNSKALVVILVGCFLPVPALTFDCPKNFDYSLGNGLGFCYKIVTESRTWSGANEACQDLHPRGGLAVFRDAREEIALMDVIRSLPEETLDTCDHQFLTSGQRETFNDCTSSFVWRPNPDLPKTYVEDIPWASGEPSCTYESTYENCLTLDLRDNRDGLNDDECSRPHCAICQFAEWADYDKK